MSEEETINFSTEKDEEPIVASDTEEEPEKSEEDKIDALINETLNKPKKTPAERRAEKKAKREAEKAALEKQMEIERQEKLMETLNRVEQLYLNKKQEEDTALEKPHPPAPKMDPRLEEFLGSEFYTSGRWKEQPQQQQRSSCGLRFVR